MKHWRSWTWATLALLTAAGCQQGPASDKAAPADAKVDSLPETEAPDKGYVMKVYALGHYFKGQPSKEWELFEEYAYDEAGREVLHKVYHDGTGATRSTAYDSSGHVAMEAVEPHTEAGRTETRHSWDAAHRVQTTEEYAIKENKLVAKATREWDDKGNLLSLKEEDMHVPDFVYKHRLRNTYDAAGRITAQYESVGDGKEILGQTWAYDAQGRLTQLTHNDSEGKPSQVEWFTYDAQGRKEKRYLQDNSAYVRTKQLEARYSYDGAGRLAQELHYKGACAENEENAGKCLVAETITYTYDEHGRLATEQREQSQGGSPAMKKRFEYAGAVIVPPAEGR